MVSVRDAVPQRIQDIRDPEARKQAAVQWFRYFHSSRREAKRLFVLFAEEDGLEYDGDDIETITGEPPVRTQS